MEMKRPLVQRLIEFNEQQPISFHVPGHKHGAISGLPKAIRNMLPFDMTEVNGLDDLHQPEEVIKEAQEELQKLYQSDASYFLVNGSTVGNLAMIYATCHAGDEVLVQRNAHKSVFNGLELVGAKSILLSPEWDEYSKTATFVALETVQKGLELYPNAKAVILTSPTYYGIVDENLENLIGYCHQKNIPVLVDEAHGAHFITHPLFPKSALDCGADVVVHSAHKTLPAMTMASYLHVKSSLVSNKKVNKYLRMLQSSSPSYVLMASLDDARAYAASYEDVDYEVLQRERQDLIDHLHTHDGLIVKEVDDSLKLLLRAEGYSGFQLLRALEEFNIYVELADPYQVLLVLPLIKLRDSYSFSEMMPKFGQALHWLKEMEQEDSSIVMLPNQNLVTELVYHPEQLEEFRAEWVDFINAIDKVAAETIIPYPPGIPLMIAGERISKEAIENLKALIEMKARFHGELDVGAQQLLVIEEKVGE